MRKSKPNLEILNQAYDALKFSHLKFANLIAILICILMVIFLNSQNEISQAIHSALFEINSHVVKSLNEPWEMTNRAKDYVDEKLYQKEINLLKEQNKALEEAIILIEAENYENKKLKGLLNFTTSSNYKMLSTRLLKSSLDLSSHGFLIPIGKNQSLNSSAYIVDGIGLVGKVIDVSSETAKVRLITSLNSKTPVVFAESREQAILIGDSTSGNKLHITYCTNLLNVSDGEFAVTSGDGSIYPYGIIVGKVVKQGEATYVQTLFDVASLEFVKVYFK